MRRQVVTYAVICDVCGAEVSDYEVEGASGRVSWEGREYAVDLCSAHQAELAETCDRLRVFVDAGRHLPAGTRGRPQKRSTNRAGSARGSALATIRTWAVDNGHTVGDRGRLPGAVMAAYQESHEAGSRSE